MATKTISIDVEAYNRLKKMKNKNESFSEVIKRVVPAPIDFAEWIKKSKHIPRATSSSTPWSSRSRVAGFIQNGSDNRARFGYDLPHRSAAKTQV